MFVWKRAALFLERLACTSRWTVWSINGKHTDRFLQKTTPTNSTSYERLHLQILHISCVASPPSNNDSWRFRLGLLQKIYKHPGVADCILGKVLHPNNISGMFLEHWTYIRWTIQGVPVMPKQFGVVFSVLKRNKHIHKTCIWYILYIRIYIYTWSPWVTFICWRSIPETPETPFPI